MKEYNEKIKATTETTKKSSTKKKTPAKKASEPTKAIKKPKSTTRKKVVPARDTSPATSTSSRNTFKSDTSTLIYENKRKQTFSKMYDSSDVQAETIYSPNNGCKDKISHDIEFEDDNNNRDEPFKMKQTYESDEEYQSENEDDYSEFSNIFEIPTNCEANKIISMLMIKNELFYQVLFEDGQIYYVNPETANVQLKEHVDKFNRHKKLKKDSKIQLTK